MDHRTQVNIDNWLNGDYSQESKDQIRQLQKDNPQDLINAFYQTLSFGTGGLRGLMGVGTNRINFYTVRAATQGLANYLLKQPLQEGKEGVLIGFDCRHLSKEFALEAAKVLAANQIKCYLYKELRPIANLSFGIRYQNCLAGIMITASHNPPQYNGYKVYWSYGGQVVPPHDQGIIDEFDRVTLSMVKIASLPHPLIHEVKEQIDQPFIAATCKHQLHAKENQIYGKELKVVYTNLHGSGITMVPAVLSTWGFTHLTLVESQATPDGDFPTLITPNPEEPMALAMGIEELKKSQGDILFATDPDTDRLGVAVMHRGEPFLFDGNQIACLLLKHICRSLSSQRMPPYPACIKTIATTELFSVIAKAYGVNCVDVLTGFKYIGEKIYKWESDRLSGHIAPYFLFGAEESYGYLVGSDLGDKDAIVAMASLCEAALQMKRCNQTLVDLLYEIYHSHGLYREKLHTLSFEGKEGKEQIDRIMLALREDNLCMIGGSVVESIEDYLKGSRLYLKTGQVEPLLLPQSNVIRLFLEDGTKLIIRPSGTEPKLKFYIGIVEEIKGSIEKTLPLCEARLEALLAALLFHLEERSIPLECR